MADRLNWGILSTGNIARQFAEGVDGQRRSRLVAVGSRDESSARTFAQRYHILRAYGDYRQVLDDPDIDAVYIGLPNHLHLPWTLEALAAGKHVLCEKPLAFNADEARRMFDAAEQHGRLLVEAFMYRSHPQTAALLNEVRRGTIGRLTMIRTSFSYHTTHIEGNIRFNAAMAGGALMDIGCYCIDFSNLLAGAPPQTVRATGHVHDSGVDDLAAGAMSYPNGVVAGFTCGMAAQTDNTACLCGTAGYITVPVPWKPSGGGRYVVDSMTPPRSDPHAPAGVARREERQPTDRPLYALEAEDFAASVLDGAPPAVTRAQSLATMRVLDEMRCQIGVPIDPPAESDGQETLR